MEPYPLRPEKPSPRSFGYTDDITEQTFAPSPGRNTLERMSGLDPADIDSSISRTVVNFLWKLIWPF